MKTTVDLPDDLFIAAKKRAAELCQPLRALIERGLRAELACGAGRRKQGRRTIRWVTVAGGLPPGVDVADRAAMHERIEHVRLARECSKLDRGFEKALAEEGMSDDLSA